MAIHQRLSIVSWGTKKLEYEVRFLPEGKRSKVSKDSTLMVAALKSDVDLATICSGKGTCGKCLVEVVEGQLSPLTEWERKRVPPEKLTKGYRLACQALVCGNVIVKVPDQSRVGRQRLVIMGKEPPVALKENVEKVYLQLEAPTLHDPRADDERILEALYAKGYKDLRIDYLVGKALPTVARVGGWKITITILGKREIINVQAGDTTKQSFGVAVDIGTTKLAVFIVDLLDGNLVIADGIMNPQIKFGEDVISRLHYAAQGEDHLREIQHTIVSGINELIDKEVADTGIKKEDLYEMVIVGNTAMHHLFAGIESKSLGLCPYPAGLGEPQDVRARDVGVEINPSGNVHLLPNVAGFVGADAIADVLASRLYEKEKLTLLMDVGTNTEVMLGNRDQIWSCSTASGPAFEGAHIRCGMRAASGAVEKVRIDPDFEVTYKTIDDDKARGICGSGIIDSVAEMLKSGVIDTSGRMILKNHKRVRGRSPGKEEFVLVFKEETSTSKEDIVITQDDVREIQKAKAAMYGGYMTLMRKSGLRKEDLSEIVIAGAFGNYIDPESARILGMIPEIPLNRISFLGNTAGSGARMCLKSLDIRTEAWRIAEKMEYIELAVEDIFEEEYINAMYMPNSRLEEFPETVAIIRAPKVVRRYVKRQG
jgi:uncharacterized 2Fe-2S/4Fe-4S cluster protein (DUF4445 family)